MLNILQSVLNRAKVKSLQLEGNSCQTGSLRVFAADVVQSNMNIKEISLISNKFETIDELKFICDAVKSRNGGKYSTYIKDLQFRTSLVNNIPAMMRVILDASHHLMGLHLEDNEIGHSRTAIIANVLAMNPPLEALSLEENNLVDNDAMLLARALQSNTYLQQIAITGNNITSIGRLVFLCEIFAVSNLSACSRSNHMCRV